MNRMKNLQILFFILFAGLVVYLMSFLIFKRTDVLNNVYNPRKFEISGKILDEKGKVIAKTKYFDDKEMQETLRRRDYPMENLFAHIVGDVSKSGQVLGVETKYRNEFVNNNILSRLKGILLSEPVAGNNVVLTVDSNVQRIASSALGNKKGAVIAVEPSSGKILAMVSKPDFDPNDLILDPQNNSGSAKKKYEKKIKQYIEEGAFLNRAMQGVYEPGSIFKVVTALAAMRKVPEWNNYTVESTGIKEFIEDEQKIKVSEYDKKAHGTVDMKQAMTVSSNIYFATLGKTIGAKNFKKVVDEFSFNDRIEIDRLKTAQAFVLRKDQSEKEVINASYGQGKDLVTPMHMVKFVSTIANGGYMMKPYIVDRIESPKGDVLQKNLPKVEKEAMTWEETQALTEMMVNVVEEGTGKKAQIKKVKVAGKTGTAENPHGDDHAWFVGFAPAQKPKIAIVVFVENGGSGGKVAAPIAKKIMKTVLDSE